MRIAAGIRGTKRAQRLSLIAAIGIGAMAFTGCSAINEQSTTRVYSASDGVRLDMGQLELRNVLIVAEAADGPGRVTGTFYNQSESDITLTISGAQGAQTEITVKPGAPTVLNSTADSSILSTVASAPGAVETVELRTSGSSSESATLQVPVMNGTLKEYNKSLPTQAPSVEATAEATASATADAEHSAEATTAP
ncbi:hypothetical protein SAMN04489740_2595 [Arthrobacter alpinus]|uniref:DNA modification methylase n=1 Tax=Arthrobacter alpinus TaxID=656366 RepID=A0A1H5LUJ0_9MICC|nr:hypothetical protein [Arthrobacter alpinus]SEE80147.1 hypothetical protein SAMN04489740_2595 [Arthrobacter alpinus]